MASTPILFVRKERLQEELITYVARNLEPYRGFHMFMRAIPEIQRRRPKARIVIVGGDEVSYSPRLPPGADLSRAPAAGARRQIDLVARQLPGASRTSEYLALLRARRSTCTSRTRSCCRGRCSRPWRRLPGGGLAHAAGGGGDPRRENGLLADFFATSEIAAKWTRRSAGQDELRAWRSCATVVLGRYDLKRVCLPAQLPAGGSAR